MTTAAALPPITTDPGVETLDRAQAAPSPADLAFGALLAGLLAPAGAQPVPVAADVPAGPEAGAAPARRGPDPAAADSAPGPLSGAQAPLAAILMAIASVSPLPAAPGASVPEPAAPASGAAPTGRPPVPVTPSSAAATSSMSELRSAVVTTPTPSAGDQAAWLTAVTDAARPDAGGPSAAGPSAIDAPSASPRAGDVAPSAGAPVPVPSPTAPVFEAPAPAIVPNHPAATSAPTPPAPDARDAAVVSHPSGMPPSTDPASSTDARRADHVVVTSAPAPAARVTSGDVPAGAVPGVESRALPEGREPVVSPRDARPALGIVAPDALAGPNAGQPDSGAPTGGDSRDHDQRPRPDATSEIVTDAPLAPRSAGPAEAVSGPRSAAGVVPVVQQLAVGIGRLRRDGGQEVSLRLDPPHLGAVRIEARLDGSQLTLQIHASVPATRDLLEQELPRLREALAQQGIVPGQVTVGLGLDGSSRRSPGDAFAPPPQPFAPAPPVATPVVAPPRWRDAGHDGFEFWV
jgi:hypothetical protein